MVCRPSAPSLRRTMAVGKRGRKRPRRAVRGNAVRLGCEVLEPRALMSATPWVLSPAWLAASARPTVDAQLSALPADTAGNNLATARTLNVSAGSVSVRESVGFRDTNDYFRFTLSASSRVSLSLTGLTKDANLQLIRDANNNRIVRRHRRTGHVRQERCDKRDGERAHAGRGHLLCPRVLRGRRHILHAHRERAASRRRPT